MEKQAKREKKLAEKKAKREAKEGIKKKLKNFRCNKANYFRFLN